MMVDSSVMGGRVIVTAGDRRSAGRTPSYQARFLVRSPTWSVFSVLMTSL
jgi:hypothetical protein